MNRQIRCFIIILMSAILIEAFVIDAKDNIIEKKNKKIHELSVKLKTLQQIHKEHLSECAFISKDMLRYGKDEVVYVKPGANYIK